MAPFEPGPLIERLVEARVEFVIVGGFAVIAHGYVRATRDLDIVPAPGRENYQRLAALLRERRGADRCRRAPAPEPADRPGGARGRRGLHEHPWPQVVHAYAIDHAGQARQVKHHIRHSPTGFEFGYEGSGPAELARCLLYDYPELETLPVSYQRFKRRFIAAIAHEALEGTIDVKAIESWVREQQAEAPR